MDELQTRIDNLIEENEKLKTINFSLAQRKNLTHANPGLIAQMSKSMELQRKMIDMLLNEMVRLRDGDHPMYGGKVVAAAAIDRATAIFAEMNTEATN